MRNFAKGNEKQQDESQLETADKMRNKKYTAPRLVEYGSFAKLTQGGAAGVTEGGVMSPACL
ncbi:MAG: lasso RiPP family leader peptide-containing protein [Acidobacteria bacterium]|nr:lasso RiPP family leader peptide-containing protein [Acidobacteriota bacterium]